MVRASTELTEDDVRKKVLEWAKINKVLHIRLHFGAGVEAGWPDDIFLFTGGTVAWIEFKRPGKEPRKLQHYRLGQLRDRGFRADWFDDSDRAVAWLQSISRDTAIA